MNILKSSLFRQVTRISQCRSPHCVRAYFVDASQQETTEDLDDSGLPDRVNSTPQSPSFYTTRAAYNDQINYLEKAIGTAGHYLRKQHLLPLPDFARASLPPLQAVWKDSTEMGFEFQTSMSTTRYRRVTKLLNRLNDFDRIATTGGCTELSVRLRDILRLYESGKKEAFLASGKRKPVHLDGFGRSYTVGRRKTSSARVWMIPVQRPIVDEDSSEQAEKAPPKVTISTILVNNIPLNQFFPLPADRERITRPFKVAGNLGKYNVFAIVRGGGTTGQSGALAHGISKAIVAHEPELEAMFRRGKPVLPINNQIVHQFCRKTCLARPSHGRTKEDWPCQGSQRGLFLLCFIQSISG